MSLATILAYLWLFSVSRTSTQGSQIGQELGPRLSPEASIVHDTSAAPRWSDYFAPSPGTMINVAEETDVEETVKYCIEKNLTFLAQSGAHGSGITFNITKEDVIINLRGLNNVTIDKEKNEITFGGGSVVRELVEAAYQNGVQIVAGACNCVGVGHVLGGGLSRLMGLYGMSIDNLLSVNLVTANGQLKRVNARSDPDLWFALRGAGANFGIVTSLTMRTHRAPSNDVWVGSLFFPAAKLQSVVQAHNDLEFLPGMSSLITFAAIPSQSDPSRFEPTVIASPGYITSSLSEARAAFAPLFALSPLVDTTAIVPYNRLNADQDSFCTKGGRRPQYAVAVKKIHPDVAQKVWDEYVAFLAANPGTEQGSAILWEYLLGKTTVSRRRYSGDAGAYPHRDIDHDIIISAVYQNASFDAAAEGFGKRVRSLIAEGSGSKKEKLKVYVNYAFGDEPLEAVYGDSLERLIKLKRKYDPYGRFNQFFPIPTHGKDQYS
ncbi:MAG: hypothetical protein M1823_002475 [Watsoniomyces obsoletus]|nr:MAG: hypothetical protein M1823_002475 [Watsoniomyces obsoletus]